MRNLWRRIVCRTVYWQIECLYLVSRVDGNRNLSICEFGTWHVILFLIDLVWTAAVPLYDFFLQFEVLLKRCVLFRGFLSFGRTFQKCTFIG